MCNDILLSKIIGILMLLTENTFYVSYVSDTSPSLSHVKLGSHQRRACDFQRDLTSQISCYFHPILKHSTLFNIIILLYPFYYNTKIPYRNILCFALRQKRSRRSRRLWYESSLKLDSHQRRASVFQRDLTGVKLLFMLFWNIQHFLTL